MHDLDLDLKDFVARVNADVVGKVVNLASRTARFVEATGLSAKYPDDGGLFANGAAEHVVVAGMPKLRARSRFQVPLKFGLVVAANTSIDTAMIAANAGNNLFAIAVLLIK